MLIELKDATVSCGGEEILSHIDFYIKGNEKIAVVGRNGAGKTTLLRLLSGELTCDRDDKRTAPAMSMSRSLTVGMLSQQVFEDTEKTVEEAEGEVLSREDPLCEVELDRMLTGLGFSKEDKKRRIREFSGGQQTKLAFIRLLLSRPELCLLDEPTNHLDLESIKWLENYLKSYDRAVVIVSHDRFFMDQVAEVIYEVRDKKLFRYPGNYSTYKEERKNQLVRDKKKYEQLMAEKKRLEELIERFKNKPRKAAMARSKKKVLERITLPDISAEEDIISFSEPIVPELLGAKWVLNAEHMVVGYDKPLYELSLRIRRGQKIAVIGANGSGKSALLKTVSGLMPQLKGRCTLGNQILYGYFDQKSGQITSEKTVLEHFTELFPGITQKDARKELARWLFKGADAAKKVEVLSGGEKARLVMLELLFSKPNFLILDEPTNHMDIQAKEVLEEAFRAYQGTMLFVSHDRYLIDKVADALLIIKEGEVYYYPFSYQHYLKHIERGEETPPGQLKAEDAALIASLRAMPKRGSLLGHELSSDEAYEDWQRGLIKKECEELYASYTLKMTEATDVCSWERIEGELTEGLIALMEKEIAI